MSDPVRSLSEIPVGHYHQVMTSGSAMRRAWHQLKFLRVLELFESPGSLLDVGCFAGSLLSMAPEERFPRQLGVDILPDQISFAQQSFGTPFRRFMAISSLAALREIPESFQYASCVEVIEHLRPEEIRELFLGVASRLETGGQFVLSTPNYASAWPLLELVLNRVSDVDYSEQHITRFTWFFLRRKLNEIVPELERYFEWEVRTTTHLLTPFLAGLIGVEAATKLGRAVPHGRWRVPFGNLALFRLRRTAAPFAR
jgi:2-polyprenyl-3-methyl-5-hydroxy-6-metoxy-1,4-benzoquinol methylase